MPTFRLRHQIRYAALQFYTADRALASADWTAYIIGIRFLHESRGTMLVSPQGHLKSRCLNVLTTIEEVDMRDTVSRYQRCGFSETGNCNSTSKKLVVINHNESSENFWQTESYHNLTPTAQAGSRLVPDSASALRNSLLFQNLQRESRVLQDSRSAQKYVLDDKE